MEDGEEESKEPERSRTMQENPQNQLTWAHRGSQRLNRESRSLYRSDLGPLYICYTFVAWSSCATPNGRIRDDAFACFGNPCLPNWVAPSSLNMRGGA